MASDKTSMSSSTVGTTGGDTTAGATPTQYARKASGLIRSVSAFDVFGMNTANGLLGLGIIWMLLYVPWLYAGANLYLSTVLAAIMLLPVTLIYLRLATIYPRSGGEYVYASRVLHPAVGFAANVSFVVGICFYLGEGGANAVYYGFAPLLQISGAQFNNQSMINAGTWLSGRPEIFGVSVILILGFLALITLFGPRTYYRAQGYMVVIGAVTLVVIALYGFLGSHTAAMSNLDHLFAQLDLGSASKLTHGSSPAFSFSQTLYSTVWPFVFLAVAFYGAYIGGEVKSPGRNQLFGGVGSLAYMTIVAIVVMGGCTALLGHTFFANLSSSMASSTFGLGAAPSFVSLVAGAIGNGYVSILLLLGFMTFSLVMVGAGLVLASRCVFAWSIDRLLPDGVSKVSARANQPYVALLVVAAAAILFSFLATYGYLTAIGANWGFYFGFATAVITGAVLPFIKRELWRSSPGARRILGLPDLVWLAILSIPIMFFWPWRGAVDVNVGVTPTHNFPQFIAFFAIYGAAFVSYFVAKAIRSRQGVDLRRNYKEIPLE